MPKDKRIKLHRAQIGKFPADKGLDVTAKSAPSWLKTLAPPWSLVMQSKNKEISHDEYEEQYKLMLDRIDEDDPVWGYLEGRGQNGLITFLCYCADRKFCHAYLLIDWLVSKFPALYKKL